MRKIMSVLLLASLFGASQVVYARGGGGGSGPMGGAPHSSGPATNGQATANSNGRFAADRDQGLDRAEDRMSAQGKEHEKASTNVKKRSARSRDADDLRQGGDRR